MSHNLEFNKEKGTVSFATAKEPAWHNLGQVINKRMTAEEAIEQANLGFEVALKPIYLGIDNDYRTIEDNYATVRSDNNAVLGIVGSKYKVLQNKEAFSFFDPILEEGEAIVETAGVLGKGERIFITAKMPDHINVLGQNDLIEQYLLITTSHDGKSATTIMFTPVRVVCNNTLNAALLGGKKSPKNKLTIKHTENQIQRINEAHKILGIQNQYRKELEEIFYNLANTKATDHDYERIIVQGLADNSSMVNKYFSNYAKSSTRFKNNVNAVLEYAFSHPTQLMSSTEHTLFGAYNAVSGWYQNVAEWNDEDGKMRSIFDSNGRVNLKQQQAFKSALNLLPKKN